VVKPINPANIRPFPAIRLVLSSVPDINRNEPVTQRRIETINPDLRNNFKNFIFFLFFK
jgi:hypothetical protein